MADGKDILEKRQKLGELVTEQRGILDKAKNEKRELTTDENAAVDRLDADIGKLDDEVTRHNESETRRTKDAEREARLKEREERFSRRQGGERERPEIEPRPGESRTLARLMPAAVRARMMKDGREHEVRALEHRASAEYRDAFYGCLMGGRNELSDVERRALSVGTATEGGNTVPIEQFFPELIKAADDRAVLRNICRVLPPVAQAQALGAPSLSADPADADWTTELGTGSEDSTMAFGKRELHPQPVAKRIKASDKLLRSSPLMIDALVRDRLGYKLGITHAKAFNTGDGNLKPLGLYTQSAAGLPNGTVAAGTGRDVEIGNGSGAVDPDKLIDARYSLREGYWPNARWHFHRNWLARFRKLKSDLAQGGNYLWQPGLSAGAPSLFLDFPYSVDEYAPSVVTHAANVYAAILGDFSWYWIVDALTMRIQRLEELYAETNQVGFILRAESDGMPVLADAFVRCLAAT